MLGRFHVVQSLVSVSLHPHELQPARLPCPSLSPGVCSNSCPLSHWCHPIISSSVTPFSSCPQSFWASRSFPMNWLLIKGPYKYRPHLFLLSMNSPMVQSGQRNLFIPFLGCCWHWPCLWKNVVVIDILSKVELIKQGFRHQNYMLNLTWLLAEGCWTSCLISECFPLIFKLRMLLLMLLPKSSWCYEQPIKYERSCACQLFFL